MERNEKDDIKVWEGEFKKKWEKIEDISFVKPFSIPIERKFNRSIIRHLNIIIDFSESIEEIDFKPSNKICILNALNNFKNIFRRENPLSILTTTFYQQNNSKFESKTILKGNGKFNLKNAIEFSLKNINDSFIKEFLIITCSITNEGGSPPPVKISFINLNAEVQFFKNLTIESNYIVPLNIKQLNEALLKISEPDSLNSKIPISFIEICFPDVLYEESICSCHLKLTNISYICSCDAKICNLPSQCPICKIQLVSSIILSQNAYHYSELPFDKLKIGNCIICNNKANSKCSNCLNQFCYFCREFLESSIRFCPFC